MGQGRNHKEIRKYSGRNKKIYAKDLCKENTA